MNQPDLRSKNSQSTQQRHSLFLSAHAGHDTLPKRCIWLLHANSLHAFIVFRLTGKFWLIKFSQKNTTNRAAYFNKGIGNRRAWRQTTISIDFGKFCSLPFSEQPNYFNVKKKMDDDKVGELLPIEFNTVYRVKRAENGRNATILCLSDITVKRWLHSMRPKCHCLWCFDLNFTKTKRLSTLNDDPDWSHIRELLRGDFQQRKHM